MGPGPLVVIFSVFPFFIYHKGVVEKSGVS